MKLMDGCVPSSFCNRVGVYLDWSAGTLSFYSVSDTHTLAHLDTFNTTFTEPVCAAFQFSNHFFDGWAKFTSNLSNTLSG